MSTHRGQFTRVSFSRPFRARAHLQCVRQQRHVNSTQHRLLPSPAPSLPFPIPAAGNALGSWAPCCFLRTGAGALSVRPPEVTGPEARPLCPGPQQRQGQETITMYQGHLSVHVRHSICQSGTLTW